MTVYQRILSLTHDSLELSALAVRQFSRIETNNAAACMQAACDALAAQLAPNSSFAVFEQIAMSDPLNVLLAIRAIRTDDVRAEALVKYMEHLREALQEGVYLIPVDQRSLVRSALTHLFNGPDSFTDIFPNDVEDAEDAPSELSPGSVARFALINTGFGTRFASVRSEHLKALLRASLLLRLRKRSLTESGLLLAAFSLLYPDDDADFARSWIARNTRRDGLLGIWELFGEDHTALALHGSVWLSFGLDIANARMQLPRGPSGVMTLVDAESAITPVIVQTALQQSLSWIESNAENFHLRPGCKDLDEFGDKIKPLVELLLLLFLLARLARRAPSLSWIDPWLARVGPRYAEYATWEGLREAIRIFPTSVLVALAFPLLEGISERPMEDRDEIERIVCDTFSASQERIPMRQMDYWFLRLLVKPGQDSEHNLDRTFDQTLCASTSNPSFFSNDAMYDWTHAVFYKTCFGTRPGAFRPDLTPRLKQLAGELGLSCLVDGDCDLGSEFLLCDRYLGDQPSSATLLMLQMLCDRVNAKGYVDAPRGHKDDAQVSEFERVYHTTLVAALAMAECLAGLGNE